MEGPGLLRRLARSTLARFRESEPDTPAAYDEPPVEVVATLTRVWWDDDHTLAVAGWVYAVGEPVTADDRPGLGVRLEGRDHEVAAEAYLASLVDPAVDEDADDTENTYAAAAFEAELDVRGLFGRDDGPWTLVFSLDADGPEYGGPVTAPFTQRDVHGSAGMLVDSAASSTGRVVRPDWSGTNGLVLTVEPGATLDVPATWATSLEADPDAGVLRVEGTTDQTSLELVLRSPRQVVRAEAAVEGGRFRGSVPLRAPDWYGVERPLIHGIYFLHTGSGELPLSPESLATVGELSEGTELHARVERTVRDTVRLRIDPPLRPDERGAHAQMRLRREYHAMPRLDATGVGSDELPVAFHECYYGVSCTDSARAIRDELVSRGSPLQHVWGVADLSVPVPAGDTAVLRHSRAWWQTLGRASYLTFNAGLPAGLVRRPGQTLVQTWHGTPLKLLGGDRPVNADRPGFAESTARYVSRWDHLLAPNPHSAEVFRRAWHYDGSVLELGYPRNDALAGRPDPELVRAVRERLGVGDERLVLYAPTWRDGQRVQPDLLDLELLTDPVAGVPDTVVLARGHMNITRWRQRPGGSRVVDVTTYPEINDLFLVADVLVTDYSSVMFDWSVTRKPMVFLVPDLEDYRDRRRGLYFDLAESAPGPLVTTTEQVAAALADLATHEEEYAARYDAWVARFNPLDDGRAAARVVEAVYT